MKQLAAVNSASSMTFHAPAKIQNRLAFGVKIMPADLVITIRERHDRVLDSLCADAVQINQRFVFPFPSYTFLQDFEKGV